MISTLTKQKFSNDFEMCTKTNYSFSLEIIDDGTVADIGIF